jgi:acetyltransferase
VAIRAKCRPSAIEDVMSIRNLERMFKPRSVALIGASARPGSIGQVVLRNLRRAGFAGPIMPVNPHESELDGITVYQDVPSLPAPPDLAVIATPPATVPGLIAQLGAKGTRAVVVISAGFGELGAAGKALQREALAASRPYLLRLVGPNCVGIMVPGLGLDASFSHLAPKRGDLAFLSQSGAMITAVLDWAAPRAIGFSHVVSLGDMADVDFGDMLDYLAIDKETRAILLYVEAIKEARKFMSAARAAARLKPVVVVKAGRAAEGARAAASHTGALAGSDAVYDAAFRRAGMLRVNDMTELFDAVETLALTRPQQGERLAILTNGGGPGVLATDALIALGGTLATLSPDAMGQLDAVLPRTWSRGNPIDIIGDADGARYSAALSTVLADKENDAVLVLNCPTALAGSVESAEAVIETIQRTHSRRNVLTVWLGEETAGPARQLFAAARIPTYPTPDSAVRGFMHGVQYRRNQELMLETPAARPSGFEPDIEAARRVIDGAIARAIAGGSAWLEIEELAAVLAAYGIPFAAPALAASAEDASVAATRMGFPVALKIRSPDLPHKSDVGGVALNLGRAERVRDEANAMLARVKAAAPKARIEGFILQPMIDRPQAVELIIGMTADPIFGPVVMFGQGGTAVEVMHDTALELPPLNAVLARALIARTRVSRLLQGYRDRKPADSDAIVETLIRIAELAADHPEIAEIDVNPLLADHAGVIAVDARIRVTRGARGGLAISPYPRDLTGEDRLEDGTVILVRPVRPEDEPMLKDIVAHMTQEDQRFRFFVPMKELPHQLAARLSQVDYAREMALLALTEDGKTALGVARYSADPDNQHAEFAIAVRSDRQGRGIGRRLMTRLIATARQRGVGALLCDVLRGNDSMLEFCRNFGFRIEHHPDDPGALRVGLALAAGTLPERAP